MHQSSAVSLPATQPFFAASSRLPLLRDYNPDLIRVPALYESGVCRPAGGLDGQDWFQKLAYILINYNKIPGDVVQSDRDRLYLVHSLQLIQDEYRTSDSADGDTFFATLIQTALVMIFNLLTRQIEASLLQSGIDTSFHSQRFMRILNYIQHNLFNNKALRIAALAGQAAMSPAYFSEYFRNHAGESLQTYITRSRLKVAETRLLHSDNSAKEIAYELGFTDTSHLSRTFKKQYGCTMQAFKKRRASVAPGNTTTDY